MEIKPLGEEYRKIVNQYIKDEWGGPMLVTRGKLFDSSRLPGFVAVENDVLLGAALYQMENDECEMATLFSLVQGRGAGSALVRAVAEQARRSACRRVWLITTNDNTPAIRFYQRQGFNLKAAHIDAFELTKKLKFEEETPLGIDGIPIRHELEFELLLGPDQPS